MVILHPVWQGTKPCQLVFFLVLWHRCSLSWVSLTACQFVFWTHWGNDCQNTPGARPFCSCQSWHWACLESWNWLVLIVSSKIPSTTLFLIFLIGFIQNNQPWSKQRKKKSGVPPLVETTKQRVLESSKQGTYGQIWYCHAQPVRNLSKKHTRIESLDAESSGNHSWPGDATSSDSWLFCIACCCCCCFFIGKPQQAFIKASLQGARDISW